MKIRDLINELEAIARRCGDHLDVVVTGELLDVYSDYETIRDVQSVHYLGGSEAEIRW